MELSRLTNHLKIPRPQVNHIQWQKPNNEESGNKARFAKSVGGRNEFNFVLIFLWQSPQRTLRTTLHPFRFAMESSTQLLDLLVNYSRTTESEFHV